MNSNPNFLFRFLVVGVFVFGLFTAHAVRADLVTFDLDNVVLDDTTQMRGVFTWTYESGDFENGAGHFLALDIPWTAHDHTDLAASFDVGNSIEITFPGNLHDDGVDITLFLLQPLTPTTIAMVDLERSKYDIGGNGFHAGAFQSGRIVPLTSVPEPASFNIALLALAGLALTRRNRKP